MGEYADFIIDSAIDGNPIPGFEAIDEFNKNRNRERYQQALLDYSEARKLAATKGLELIRHSEYHYKLKTPWGVYELYPGRCRIFSQKRSNPYIQAPKPWRILDVVKSAVKMADQFPDGGEA